MKRLPGLLLSFFCLATVLQARVISYAPYTDRTTVAAYQSRTTRHFLLIELTNPYYYGAGKYDVVLYDSAGAEEPRVVYSSTRPVYWAALREDDGTAPSILIYQGATSSFSSDGGQTFQDVALFAPPQSTYLGTSLAYVDNGGPFTRGRGAPVRVGTREFPFVLYDTQGAIWRIGANGETTRWLDAYRNHAATLIGSSADHSRFIVRIDETRFVVASLDGTIGVPATLPNKSSYNGWVAPDGRVYLEGYYTYNNATYTNGLWVHDGTRAEPISGGFAIPTHDYSGAWILVRDPNSVTVLFRHTREKGREEMWVDRSAPEVEALHAGASGNTLLIQVHRPRPLPDKIAVKDPALAVWRVGEPAPKSYDELFLVEEPNKGFIHVDPDRIAEGEPFVFDSGLTMTAPPPVIISAGGGGGEVLQEFGVVRASLRQRLVLPGVGRTLGAYGSNWTTDVVIYNPEPVPQKVELRYVQNGLEVSASSAEDTKVITMNAREIRVIPDVLGTLFTRTGSGALFFSPELTINATARTYTRSGSGTYGFGMNAIDVFAAASPRFPVTFSGAFPGPGYRTNVTLTDTTGRGADATLVLDNKDLASYAVPAAGQQQVNLFGSRTPSLVVRPKRGFLVAGVYAIDNVTNDPTYFSPDLPSSFTRWIPVFGRVDGANGTRFRTDLFLHNPSSEWRYVYLFAHPWNGQTPARAFSVSLSPNESRVIEDAYPRFGLQDGMARLRYYSSSPTQGARVAARTYTVGANGGTYGSVTPPVNGFQIVARGESLEMLAPTGGAGFRTNIGIVEMNMWPAAAWEDPASARVELIDERGHAIDDFTVTVPFSGGTQLNDVFRSRGHGDGPPAARIRVSPLRGQFTAYATVTDNSTNDSIYVAPYLAAQE